MFDWPFVHGASPNERSLAGKRLSVQQGRPSPMQVKPKPTTDAGLDADGDAQRRAGGALDVGRKRAERIERSTTDLMKAISFSGRRHW
ncbi:MAG: hypothetical protein IPH41_17525, partial [Sulfuritalea sp.]|nr:hypothetical protein [Sulfuritalea sp.]